MAGFRLCLQCAYTLSRDHRVPRWRVHFCGFKQVFLLRAEHARLPDFARLGPVKSQRGVRLAASAPGDGPSDLGSSKKGCETYGTNLLYAGIDRLRAELDRERELSAALEDVIADMCKALDMPVRPWQDSTGRQCVYQSAQALFARLMERAQKAETEVASLTNQLCLKDARLKTAESENARLQAEVNGLQTRIRELGERLAKAEATSSTPQP